MKWWAFAILLACSSPSESGPTAGGSGSAPVAKKDLAFDLCHGPWCWVSGRPQGNQLRDVTTHGTELWAVGGWGTVMHHDGTRWTAESIGTARLEAVWVAPTGEVWVIGDGGFIAKRDAKGWHEFPPVVPKQKVRGVAGSAADDVWVTGDNGLLLHWDGKQLGVIKSITTFTFLEPVVLGKDDVWISTGGGITKWNGKELHYEEVPGLGLSIFHDMRAFSPTDVWALDDLGVVYHWDGKLWWASSDTGMTKSHKLAEDEEPYHSYTSGARAHGRFSGTKDDFWVTGSSSMARFENGHWRDKGSLPKWMSASTRLGDQIVAVGRGGMIKRLAPKAKWAEERTGIDFSVQRMWSDGAGTLVVAGYGAYFGIHGKLAIVKEGVATAIKYDGPAGGLAGRSATDFYLSGSDGEMRHHDGKAWTKMATPTKETVRWMSLPWAVGDKGTILKLDGAAWTSVPSPVTGDIQRVWSASPKLAWAIADDGKGSAILKWDGTAWSVADKSADKLYDLDGVDDTHAWITGSKGVLEWNGKAWTPMASWPKDTRSYWLDARANDDVWVTSYRAVWRWDGKAWTEEKIGLDSASSILVEKDAVWLGDEDGALLRRKR